MTLKDFKEVNPRCFALLIFEAILMPVLNIANTGLVQLETNVLLTRKLGNFLLIEVVMLTVMVGSYALTSHLSYLESRQIQLLSHSLRAKIVKHYYDDQKNHAVADMQNHLTNDLDLGSKYYDSFFHLVSGFALVVSVIVYLIMLNWLLLIAIAVMVGISLALPKLIEKPLQKATEQVSISNQKYLDMLEDWLSGLDEIRQFLAGAKLFKVSAAASKKLEDANVKQTAFTQLLSIITGSVSAVFGLLLFILTGILVKNGTVSVGTLLVIGNFRYYLNMAIKMIANARGQMKGTDSLRKQIVESATAITTKSENQGAVPAAIITESLSLQFPNGEKLSFPDLNIKKGEKILLSGDSGSGKSTLLKLILGDLKPTTGKVIFKDKTGQVIKPNLAKIGYLPQDPILFPATIADNITMFNDKLVNQVDPAIDEVNFRDDINKFPHGVREEINLDKLNISGGQRQKIVLARAKIHDSEIILIDEGTSAIDQKATLNILKNLVQTKATIIFIAHNFNEKMRSLFDREIHLVKR